MVKPEPSSARDEDWRPNSYTDAQLCKESHCQAPSTLLYQLGVNCAFGEGACSACVWLGIAGIPMGKLSQPLPNWHQGVMKTSLFAHDKWTRLEDGPLMRFINLQRMQEDSGHSGPALVLVWGFNQSNTKLFFLGGKQILRIQMRTRSAPGHTWSAPAVLTLIYFYSFF